MCNFCKGGKLWLYYCTNNIKQISRKTPTLLLMLMPGFQLQVEQMLMFLCVLLCICGVDL